MKAIKGFKELDNADLYALNKDIRRTLSDVFHY